MSETMETPEKVAERLVKRDGRDVTSPATPDMRIVGEGVSHAPPPSCSVVTVGFANRFVANTTYCLIRSAIIAALRERDAQWREKIGA